MMINFISAKLNNTAFGTFNHGKHDTIANIPQLPCAKCGSLMLTPREMSQYALSLRCKGEDIFESNELEKYKDKKVFKAMKTLAKLKPNASITEILNTSILKGDDVKDYLAIIKDGKILYKKSKDSIEIFKQLKPRMKPFEQHLVDVLEYYSVLYPNNTFERIFKKTDVVKSYLYKYNEQNDAQRKTCDSIFAEMKKALPNLSKEQQEELNYLNEKAYNLTINLASANVKREELRNIYRNFISHLPTAEERIGLINLIKTIPVVETTMSRALGSFVGKTDEQILCALLSNLHSQRMQIYKDNSNHINNTLRVCAGCNDELSHISLNEALVRYHDFASNIQKQIDVIIANILAGKLADFKDYPFEVGRRLAQHTHQKVKVDTSALAQKVKDTQKPVKVLKHVNDEEFMKKEETVLEILNRMQFIQNKLKELRKNPKVNQELITEYRHIYELCKIKKAKMESRLSAIPKAYY
ncbi:MAG: hypothetical protein MJ180_05455 [Candidatus Gastranaerophilales bacterium]|nr:hypothetical protein [Candidatus Gastranaerophilales bacterium]